ncbi:MAG: reactive intermediate/imine deaminase [Bacteroidia bacterium]|nr:MAG: reactive intermediate/imine deaminase [Bacteroidia bacterium]
MFSLKYAANYKKNFTFAHHIKKMLEKKSFNTHKAPEPVGKYPHAKKVGNLLFLSGVGPRKPNSQEIPGVTLDEKGNILNYDIEIQCRSVFENVKIILEEAGLQWTDIVDVTVFLTNMKKDFPIYNQLWAEYFSENPPCRTTIEILSLPTPIAIELKVIAAYPENT